MDGGVRDLGHLIGHRAQIAQRLEGCLRATDTVARLGGDEFTILLEDVRSAEEIGRIADKLLRAISARADVAGHEMHLSTSIGVTVYPLDNHDADALLRNADLAMYHAKQEGRNNVQFFSREMSDRTEKRVDLLGFGAEIGSDLPAVRSVARALDAEGTQKVIESVESVGQRHRSAYRLCNFAHDAVAIVVSQDGTVRFVKWHEGQVTYWDNVATSVLDV